MRIELHRLLTHGDTILAFSMSYLYHCVVQAKLQNAETSDSQNFFLNMGSVNHLLVVHLTRHMHSTNFTMKMAHGHKMPIASSFARYTRLMLMPTLW